MREAHSEALAAVDKLARLVTAQKVEWGVYDHLEDADTGDKVDIVAELEESMATNFVVAVEYQIMTGDADDTMFIATAPFTKISTKIGLATMMLNEFSNS